MRSSQAIRSEQTKRAIRSEQKHIIINCLFLIVVGAMSSSSSNISTGPPAAAAVAAAEEQGNSDNEVGRNNKRRRSEAEENGDGDKKETKTPMDVSDLAPFVAAVLRDRAAEDLVRENERLRSEIQRLRDRLKVTIVDRGTGTILAEADDVTANKMESEPADGHWVLDVDRSAVHVDFESVGLIDIKVGNRTVETINLADISVRDGFFDFVNLADVSVGDVFSDYYILKCDVGLRDRPSPCVYWCWIKVSPSYEDSCEVFAAAMGQSGIGLIELLHQLKDRQGPKMSVKFERIFIAIGADELLAIDDARLTQEATA